jgi:voltage-gated potassium channel
MMIVGTLGYVAIDDFSLMDAIFQTGITFTTVGFGEIAPISDVGRIFTITLIILGFAIFSFSLATLADEVNRGDLFSLIKERSMLHKIARLKNHYVICFHNKYTIQLAREFKENHIPFVVIDNDPKFDKTAEQHKYPYYVKGEPHTELAMLKSFLSSAKGVITFSESLADNIAMISLVRLFEKEHDRKPFIITSYAESILDIDKLKKIGADNVLSPAELIARRVTSMSLRPDMQNLTEEFLYKAQNPIDMEEIPVKDGSWVIYKKLRDTNIRDIVNVSVVGVRRADGEFIPMPNGDHVITQKDVLLIIGTPANVDKTKRLLSLKAKPKMAYFNQE